MTAYSPSMLALNDMLRMQVDLTTQFLMTQKRLHHDLLRNLDSSYCYTTFQDTKEVSIALILMMLTQDTITLDIIRDTISILTKGTTGFKVIVLINYYYFTIIIIPIVITNNTSVSINTYHFLFLNINY